MAWKIYRHPSDPDGSSPDSSDENQDKAGESIAPPTDPTVQLQADLKAARTEAADWQDRFLRKAAEFENYRKRSEKEKVDSMAMAKGAVLLEFLPIADACERALGSFNNQQEKAEGLAQYREGVELLYKQLIDTLGKIGAVPMQVEGKPFDPHLHEALAREETLEIEENTVVQELRRGYLFKEKLLRAAQVKVAVRPQTSDKSS